MSTLVMSLCPFDESEVDKMSEWSLALLISNVKVREAGSTAFDANKAIWTVL
jgi:hypothetical protein